jgi:hypothetical protein
VGRKIIKPSISLQKDRSIPLVQQLLTQPVRLSDFVLVVFYQKPQIFFFPRCFITIPEMNIGVFYSYAVTLSAAAVQLNQAASPLFLLPVISMV